MLTRLQQLSARERNILILALLLGVLLALSKGVPALRGLYVERAQQIEQLRDAIVREQRLIDDTELWRERRMNIDADTDSLEARLFTGNSSPMIAAAIQRLVRQYAADAGITIVSARLAEPQETGDWLMVAQSLSFTLTDQSATLQFLQQLEQSSPYLGVTHFTMRRARNQYTGDITVVGFSRLNVSRLNDSAAVTARLTTDNGGWAAR